MRGKEKRIQVLLWTPVTNLLEFNAKLWLNDQLLSMNDNLGSARKVVIRCFKNQAQTIAFLRLTRYSVIAFFLIINNLN